ncbi:MAG TPA: histone-like nucleoid-structuring protein Lsr2 [Acidimicrobiales bacterium]|nr:histone-like nucleoid-structuring protein Lsr2 [Acidimicrobiales bacterium]
MARNRIVVEQVLCDICGEETNEPTTVILGWGKEQWQVDLCERDNESVGRTFDSWLTNGRKVSSSRRAKKTSDAGPTSNAAVREWALANGFTVGTKGRLSQAVRDAYADAHR